MHLNSYQLKWIILVPEKLDAALVILTGDYLASWPWKLGINSDLELREDDNGDVGYETENGQFQNLLSQ